MKLSQLPPHLQRRVVRGGTQRRGGKGRTTAGKQQGMNGTEEWYSTVLDARVIAGEVAYWEFEALKLRLGNPGQSAWYTPDFLVQLADGSLELHETKGHWEEAAKVRFKTAARLYPAFRFLAVEIQGGKKKGYTVAKEWEG